MTDEELEAYGRAFFATYLACPDCDSEPGLPWFDGPILHVPVLHDDTCPVLREVLT